MAENTTLRKLDLHNESYYKVSVLHGIAGNTSIEDLVVWGELIVGLFYTMHDRSVIFFHPNLIACSLPQCAGSVHSGDDVVAEALATTCVANTNLRSVMMMFIPPLPVMKSLTTRQVPLEELVIGAALVCWLQCLIEQLIVHLLWYNFIYLSL